MLINKLKIKLYYKIQNKFRYKNLKIVFNKQMKIIMI